jgi:hypothetical protein
MTGQSTSGTDRIPPLNLNEEEAEYLWEIMKEEVGKEEVQYGDKRKTVESLHTKVRSVQPETQQEVDR